MNKPTSISAFWFCTCKAGNVKPQLLSDAFDSIWHS